MAAGLVGAPIDLNGNLTGDGTNTYAWNARNQLASLSGGTGASFVYDGVGRRQAKTISGTTTAFLYDGSNFVQELTSGGTPTANLLTGLGIDEAFTRTDSGGTSTFLTDALGSTLELADASGTLQTHYTFEPFGASSVTGTTSTNSAQFTGRENDGTGLYYYRSRYYNFALGRFVAEDPSGFAGGDTNLAAYVANSPMGYRDPSGHFAPLLVLPVAGCIGGAAGAAIGNAMTGRKTSWGDIASGCGMGAGIGLGAAALGLGAATAAGADEAGTTISTFRYTREGETFFHYGYESQAENFTSGLRPGSYATSIGNLSGEEAQSGLALSHSVPPDAIYTVSPEPGTVISVNPAVRPQFGQPGGLPEVQFPVGTGPGSVSGPGAIP